jgi:hypothetical protein
LNIQGWKCLEEFAEGCGVVEMTGNWRKLHTDELRDMYLSPNISRVTKSRLIRWFGHVARKGDREICSWDCLGEKKI